MIQAVTPTPHPNFTEGTQAADPVKYNVSEGERTFGERFYDVMNYGVIGYGANLVLSVAMVELMKQGAGRPWWDGTDRFATKQFSKFMTPERAKAASAVTQKYFWLTSSGHMLMAPMLWAENRKSKLVYLANRTWSPQQIAADDPNKDKSASEILSSKFDENLLPQPVEKQPKQGVLNATWRRVLGMMLVIGWGNVLENSVGETYLEDKGLKLIDKGTKAIGAKRTQKFFQTDPYRRWTSLTIADAINTLITSATIYMTNGGKVKKKKQAEQMAEEAPTATQAETTLVSAPAEHSHEPATHIQDPHIHANSNVKQTTKPTKLEAQTSYVDTFEHGDQGADLSMEV